MDKLWVLAPANKTGVMLGELQRAKPRAEPLAGLARRTRSSPSVMALTLLQKREQLQLFNPVGQSATKR
jgi:hypothetical protein